MGSTPYLAHDDAAGLLKTEGTLLLKLDAVGGRPLKMTCTLSLPLLLPRYVTRSICKFGLQGVPCVDGRANRRCATATGITGKAHAINTSSHNKFFSESFMPCLTLLVFDLSWRRESNCFS